MKDLKAIIKAFAIAMLWLGFHPHLSAQECDITWTDFDFTAVSGTSLYRFQSTPNGWKGDAHSIQAIPENSDGYVIYEVSPDDHRQIFGLTVENNSASYTDLEYYLNFIHNPFTSPNVVYLTANGSNVSSTSYAVGDKFKIERSGNIMIFSKKAYLTSSWVNLGSVSAYLPTTSATLPQLIADCSLHAVGCTISNAKISACDGSNPMVYPRATAFEECDVTWIDLDNTVVNGTILTRINGSGWNADANSEQVIPANSDGYASYEVSPTDTFMTFGLTDANDDASYPNIEYRFYVSFYDPPFIYSYAHGVQVFEGFAEMGDNLRIRREGETMHFERKIVGTSDWVSLRYEPAFIPLGSSTLPPLIVDCAIKNLGSTVRNAKISCLVPQSYAEMKVEMDGAYYKCVDGILKFELDESYFNDSEVANLSFYNEANQMVFKPNHIVKNLGSNLYGLDLKSDFHFVDGEFYVMKATDSKDRARYLKFQFNK